MDDAGEKALVARALNGDRQAFEVLVGRYEKVLYNVALRMTNNCEDAQDLTQSAFLKAYQGLRGFDTRYRFFSWIYRILINETLNHLKRRRPQQEVPDSFASGGPSTEERVAEEETRTIVNAALLDLSPEHRQLVVLRHLLGMSYAEIGQLVQLPEKTIKWRLYEARRNLGDALRRRGIRES